ncbi:MAG: hypothetical protein JNK82_06295 [Myxococcaceae bacterium]|nr:hypothetical protein [Myxococcaceae bacterium]
MSGSFRVDDSRWPIAVITVEGVLDDVQVDAYVAAGTQLLERGEPYVVVIDLRAMGTVTAYARARNTQWAEAHREQLHRTCRGSVFVITSPLLRFVTMTALLLAPLPMPYAVRRELDEALVWAEAQRAAKG